MTERVYDHEHGIVMHLTEKEGEGVEVLVDAGDTDITMVLNKYGVRNLRLILTRYEKRMKE